MYLKKDRESCIQGKRGKNTWDGVTGRALYPGESREGKESEIYQGKGRGGVSGKGKGTYIRRKESEIYQGKGRGGVLGKGKGTYIRGKEREVISGVRKGRYIREREGNECQD